MITYAIILSAVLLVEGRPIAAPARDYASCVAACPPPDQVFPRRHCLDACADLPHTNPPNPTVLDINPLRQRCFDQCPKDVRNGYCIDQCYDQYPN
jgi:hypothetical protein